MQNLSDFIERKTECLAERPGRDRVVGAVLFDDHMSLDVEFAVIAVGVVRCRQTGIDCRSAEGEFRVPEQDRFDGRHLTADNRCPGRRRRDWEVRFSRYFHYKVFHPQCHRPPGIEHLQTSAHLRREGRTKSRIGNQWADVDSADIGPDFPVRGEAHFRRFESHLRIAVLPRELSQVEFATLESDEPREFLNVVGEEFRSDGRTLEIQRNRQISCRIEWRVRRSSFCDSFRIAIVIVGIPVDDFQIAAERKVTTRREGVPDVIRLECREGLPEFFVGGQLIALNTQADSPIMGSGNLFHVSREPNFTGPVPGLELA